MSLIILIWCTGAILFLLRMVSGWWYVSKIKNDAVEIKNAWSLHLQHLVKTLQINRIVVLAQSTRVHTPMVIGLVKPMILIPASMLSGLSFEQIETILIHELAHIKRYDYFINLVQTIIESIFFFNPFVWIISNIIRREREYCCDDEVILQHGHALAYAHALAHLEDVRLQRSMFTLALAENKNQLLNRIRRIMENSAKNYSGKDRLVPALLLVAGLICASWLTIRTDRGQKLYSEADHIMTSADTTIKKNRRSAEPSRTTFITIDENGKAHEEVIETFEGNGEFQAWALREPINFAAPYVPSVAEIPYTPDFHAFAAVPPFPEIFHPDTIPNRFGSRREDEWKQFREEFEKKFEERFGEFYKSHEKDLEKMMKEMEENFVSKFQYEDWSHMRALAEPGEILHEEMIAVEEHAKMAMEEAVAHLQPLEVHELQELAHLDHLENELQAQEMALKVMEADLISTENNMRAFEKALHKMLIEDGYLDKSDKIKSFKREKDGAMEVNEKKIKDTDLKKYNSLHRQFFKPGYHYWNIE